MSIFTKLTLLGMTVLGLFFVSPAKASAPTPTLIQVKQYLETLSPVDLIKYYSDVYNAPKNELLKVSFCESSYLQSSVGDHGKAVGIFQYHKQTFDAFSKLMGEELDYNSANDQAKLTAFIFSTHPELKKHWTCYH